MNNLWIHRSNYALMNKRKTIKTLVNFYVIDERCNLKVDIRVNILDLLQRTASADFNEIQTAETYTHTQWSRVHRHPSKIIGNLIFVVPVTTANSQFGQLKIGAKSIQKVFEDWYFSPINLWCISIKVMIFIVDKWFESYIIFIRFLKYFYSGIDRRCFRVPSPAVHKNDVALNDFLT